MLLPRFPLNGFTLDDEFVLFFLDDQQQHQRQRRRLTVTMYPREPARWKVLTKTHGLSENAFCRVVGVGGVGGESNKLSVNKNI